MIEGGADDRSGKLTGLSDAAPERAALFLLEMNARLAADNEIVLPMGRKDISVYLESVRKDHVGLHSFLSMSLIDARRRNARPRRLRFSQSLARRLHRPSHANVRSTTHRLGKTMKPFA